MKTRQTTAEQPARVAVKIHLSSDPTWPRFSVSLPGHQITRWFKTRGAAKRYITLNGFTVYTAKPMVRVAQDKLEALKAAAVALAELVKLYEALTVKPGSAPAHVNAVAALAELEGQTIVITREGSAQ
jgi:hypothetical protein